MVKSSPDYITEVYYGPGSVLGMGDHLGQETDTASALTEATT
jgi:hypothetical protein